MQPPDVQRTPVWNGSRSLSPRPAYRQGANVRTEKLPAHLNVDRYGDFVLTAAIRPGAGVPVTPRQGYRRDVYRDQQSGAQVPVLAAAVSRETLFDCFVDLVELLGPVVDVVMETSHDSKQGGHRDLMRHHIDLPVLLSHFYDHEDLLLNDGCTGTAILAQSGTMEVQFDEHKLLVVYAQNLAPFEEVFARHGVKCIEGLRLITEGEHLHSTEPHYQDEFEQMCCRIGVAEMAERVNW